MRAYVVPQGCRSIDEIRQVDRPTPSVRPGQVHVRLRATSLNRRDQAVAAGTYFGQPVTRDTIPLSDGAGDVIAVADDVTRFAAGDRVVSTFFQIPSDGPWSGEPRSIGSPLDGTLVEEMVVYEDGLLPIPAGVSYDEAACLPCAALTAWNALMETGRPIAAGDTVLVLGTGGVSMFALQFAIAAGARVIVTSSSDAKLERVAALGAWAGVNYARTPDWHKDVLALTAGRGVDCVVEVGGVGTLERSIDSLARHGKIGLVGVLTGRSAPLNPNGLMWKEGALYGIRVGTPAMFGRMLTALTAHHIRPVIDRVFPFDEAIPAYAHQAKGAFIGKIVISV